jgi:hypothetical protein
VIIIANLSILTNNFDLTRDNAVLVNFTR